MMRDRFIGYRRPVNLRARAAALRQSYFIGLTARSSEAYEYRLMESPEMPPPYRSSPILHHLRGRAQLAPSLVHRLARHGA